MSIWIRSYTRSAYRYPLARPGGTPGLAATDNWNQNPTPFKWHKTADDIFETMAAYLQRILQTGR